MSAGGWKTFREASKHKAIASTAAAELERPAVSHRLNIPPVDEPVLEVHETTPSTAPILPDEPPPPADETLAPGDGTVAPEEDAPVIQDDISDKPDPDELVAAAVAIMTPAWPPTRAAKAKSRLRPAMRRKTGFKRVAPWYGLAVVPVAGALSLIAMRAGLNPYALCLQWWDLLLGSIFFSAAALFIGLSMWTGLKNAWRPAAPALGVLVVVSPLWLAMSLAWGSGCGAGGQTFAAMMPAAAAPPLPPPVDVRPVWGVPMPQQRPPELHYQFTPQQLDIETGQLNFRASQL